jgi:hypothetical protein
MAIRLRLPSLFLLISPFSLLGCEGPPFAKVEGHITFQGQPLQDVQVLFYPDAGGPRSVGFTDENGYYQLSTEAIQRSSAQEGLLVGTHHVCLKDMQELMKRRPVRNDPLASRFGRRPAEKPKHALSGTTARFPAAYTTLNDTPWQRVEVKSGEQTIDLDVK